MQESGQTLIEVTDNDSGISTEVIEKVFMPFYTTKKNGSGIGLSMVKLIAQSHKAYVGVESESGIHLLKFICLKFALKSTFFQHKHL